MAFDRQKYLQPSLLCDFDRSPQIRRKALELTAGCRNNGQRLLKIFEFVKEMPYGLEDWDVRASQSLKKGWGMCSGKTNLMVALLRSIGIPSRYRIYRIKADMYMWDQAGRTIGRADRIRQLGQQRDHVDCEVWLGKWVDCDPGRDSALEKGILKLGGKLKRRYVTDCRGRVRYLRLAVFDEWATKRQERRTFRSDRKDVFAGINSAFNRIRELGRS